MGNKGIGQLEVPRRKLVLTAGTRRRGFGLTEIATVDLIRGNEIFGAKQSIRDKVALLWVYLEGFAGKAETKEGREVRATFVTETRLAKILGVSQSWISLRLKDFADAGLLEWATLSFPRGSQHDGKVLRRFSEIIGEDSG